jgi:hypothetical protein
VFKFEKFIQLSKLRKNIILCSVLSAAIGGLYFSWNHILAYANFTDRVNSTMIGIRIFQDHPIFGVGIEQFWRFQGQYKSISQAQFIGDNFIVDKAHNVFIDYFANGGAITGILFIIFAVFSILQIYKISNAHMTHQKRLEVAFFSAIWFGYILQLFFTTDSLFTMSFAFINLGLLVSFHHKNFHAEKSLKVSHRLNNSWVIRVTLSFLLLLLAWLTTAAIKNDLMIKSVVTNQLSDGKRIFDSIKDFPNPRGSEIIIAHVIRNVENCKFASMVSNELIKVDNRSAQGWYFKSLCSNLAEDQISALNYINQALKFQPTNTEYLELRFRLEYKLEMFPAATLTLDRITEISPNSTFIPELRNLLHLANSGS